MANQMSASRISFTPTQNAYLSFDWGSVGKMVSDGAGCFYIDLIGSDGSEIRIVDSEEESDSGTVSKQPLTADVTYTLQLISSSDSASDFRTSYIDNLLIAS